MGLKFARRKRRHLWLSILWRLGRLPWAPPRTRLKVFLNLHWLLGRLAHEEYHRVFGVGENKLKAGQIAFLDAHMPSGSVVVDAGCGEGDLAGAMAARGHEVVGVDHDPAVLAVARERYPFANLKFVEGDVREILTDDNDRPRVLVLTHVLEHLDEPGEFLVDVARRFHTIMIEVPDFEHSHLNRYREQLGLDLAYGDADHISEFDRRELAALIRNAGLRVVVAEFGQSVQRIWCERDS